MSNTDGALDVEWHNVGRVSNWSEGAGQQVFIGARRIAVFLHQGRWYALKDYCPHDGHQLADGRLLEGEQVACARHGWQISLCTGEVQRGMPGISVRTYPVRVEGDQVQVGV